MSDRAYWSNIKSEYRRINDIIGDIRFPEKIDIELYQLGFQITGRWPHHDNHERYHHFYYAQTQERMLETIPHLAVLGLHVPHTFRDTPFIQESIDRNISQIVKKGIESFEFTAEFCSAWGEYNFSAGCLISLICMNDVEKQEAANVIKNIYNPAGKFITAFWMKKYWIECGLSKEKAMDKLYDFIINIDDQSQTFPEWKISALKRMISKDDSGITSTYLNINKQDVLKMVGLAKKFTQDIEI